jgi:hypothetical protein
LANLAKCPGRWRIGDSNAAPDDPMPLPPNDLCDAGPSRSVSCQCSAGTDCRPSSPADVDPTLVRLMEVWGSLPPNVKRAIEALCLENES